MALRALVPPQSSVVLLGRLIGANMNSTADQAITLRLPGRFWMTPGMTVATANCGIFTNVSGTIGTAAGGVYTAAGKTGSQVVTAAQSYAGLVATTDVVRGVAAGAGATTTFTTTTVYLSLTTAAGAACTADVYIYGLIIP